jgi:transaldolase/glucose-6-phosphate isomerase
MATINELIEMGQAIWLDFIRRSLITSGELQSLIDEGLRGVTFNPTIFNNVIAGSADYDSDLERLFHEGKAERKIYEALALEDVRRTAGLLYPVYETTDGGDGYVSIEVNPVLAHDTEGTIAEARDLFARLDQPNVMIKVPATKAGIPAIEALISEGINVNVTLIFSLKQYQAAAEAYIAGLERLIQSGGGPRRVASVASFFVSRVDTVVDAELERAGNKALQGKIAIANAKMAYARFREIFSGDRWENLAKQGGRGQRVLWASTGTKNPAYSDVLYVEELIGPETVNTVPPAVLRAFRHHGRVARTLENGLDEARDTVAQLDQLSVNLEMILEKLQEEGVKSFQKSFHDLISGIAGKRSRLIRRQEDITFKLGPYRDMVDHAMAEVRDNRVMSRIWAHDHTVWKPDSTEITNRLGWLHSAEVMTDAMDRLGPLAETIRSEGYTHALLLGMGGSSLAPEVFSKTFGTTQGYLELAVLDSTDPDAVVMHAERLDPGRTLLIVSTKSGGTVETLSLFKFFYNWVVDALGKERVGEHFIAITDPGSSLADLAEHYRFRSVFLNDPNIGGRYSVLSYFGLVPAALIGMDVKILLNRALIMSSNCESCNCPIGGNNDGARLGVVLGEMAKAGRDKVTIIASPAVESFSEWVEQLIAESTGKEGKGIVPVVGEEPGVPDDYGDDRLFVHLRLDGDSGYDEDIGELERHGHPLAVIKLRDQYDLGKQFFLWEMAIAVAGHRMNINPFDQPDVESAKVLARRMVTEYREKGSLPDEPPSLKDGDIIIFGGPESDTAAKALIDFVERSKGDGSYVAIQAYVKPDSETYKALQTFRIKLRNWFRMATTLGYGPRFLHSTGQLHKGDAGKGIFIQVTSENIHYVSIPDEAGRSVSSMSFGVLKMAQALGDREALRNAGRHVIRFHMVRDVVGGLNRLSGSM